MLKQVEAVLSTRPLIAVDSSIDDVAAINPSHYSIGRPVVAIREPVIDISVSLTKRCVSSTSLSTHLEGIVDGLSIRIAETTEMEKEIF